MNAANQFESIVSDHYEALFRFAMSLTRAESDAWDLTQQTFYIWATKGHQLRDVSKVKTWLYTTLHRVFLADRRKGGRFPHQDLEAAAIQLPAISPEQADRVDSSQAVSALAGVDEVYRAAVALFYLEDYSYKEISAALEVPVGTVKSRIARGIAQLREIVSAGSFCSTTSEINGMPNDGTVAESPADPVTDSGPSWSRNDLATELPDRSYNEWDLGSTFLGDSFAPA